MKKYEKELNQFFIGTFNKILAWEEKAVRKSGLDNISVKELHVVEAVCLLVKKDASTMSRIAEVVGITVGALTTAVNALVRKNYLYRGSDEKDRRVVYIYPTELGLEAFALHEEFHKKMIAGIMKTLDERSLQTLTSSLGMLSNFFENITEEIR